MLELVLRRAAAEKGSCVVGFKADARAEAGAGAAMPTGALSRSRSRNGRNTVDTG